VILSGRVCELAKESSRARSFLNLTVISVKSYKMSNVANVVFGKLAEVVLRAALVRVGRSEDTIAFPDDLSCGPLNPLGASREIWMQENLHLSPAEWGIFPHLLQNFFNTLKLRRDKIIFWVCEHSAFEICGFDQCIDQISGEFYYVNTMNAAQFEHRKDEDAGFPPRLAHISPEVAAQLIGSEVPLAQCLRSEHLEDWQKLCTENAPLRIIGPQGIRPVSVSHFDPLLLSFTNTEWEPAQWVITQAAVEANNDNFFRVDMMVLTGRLRALVKQGRLVADKDITDREMRVRLPR
jgi:hypothetical protein